MLTSAIPFPNSGLQLYCKCAHCAVRSALTVTAELLVFYGNVGQWKMLTRSLPLRWRNCCTERRNGKSLKERRLHAAEWSGSGSSGTSYYGRLSIASEGTRRPANQRRMMIVTMVIVWGQAFPPKNSHHGRFFRPFMPALDILPVLSTCITIRWKYYTRECQYLHVLVSVVFLVNCLV